MAHNIPKAYAARWLALTDGRRMNNGPHGDMAHWRRAGREMIDGRRPFRDLDLLAVGKRLPAFQEWLDHPELDEYWAGRVPTRRQYHDIDIPVLTITGQYDDDQLGALTYHAEHTAAARPGVAEQHQVVIGPWDHAGTRSGARAFGGLTFAEASQIDLLALHADWYRWVLGKAGRPCFLRDRVTYFHVGEDVWKSAPEIPGGERSLVFYPTADATPSQNGHRVLALKPPTTAQTFSLVADPRQAVDGERDEPLADRYFTDTRPLLAPREASLVHVSAPLTGFVDIAGRFRTDLTLCSGLPDFDLLIGIYLLPHSASPRLLGEAGVRARYRTSLRRPSAWPAGEPTTVQVTDFPFVSLRAEPGDRFALLIRPPHRRWQTNLQAGGPTADETMRDAVPGEIQLVQDPEQPSRIALPLA